MNFWRFGGTVQAGAVLCLLGVLLAGCVVPSANQRPAGHVAWGADPAEARNAYDRAMVLLAGGRQADADVLVDEACTDHPHAQRLLFLRGVLERSRFSKEQSFGSFAETYRIDRDSALGQAANIVVSVDVGTDVEVGFEQLASLIEKHPDELLLRWIFVVEAMGRPAHAKAAAHQCEAILEQWRIGPVTLHQAYASLLTGELDRPQDALSHRQLAAELEPGPDTYEGLARTLESLGDYSEAEGIYAKLVELAPERAIHWFQWGNCLAYMGRYEAAAIKFEKAYALDKKELLSLLCWGRCLERLGQPDQAVGKYRAAVRANPLDQQAAAYLAHAKLYGYGTACNFEGALEASAHQGKPAIEILRERIRMADKSDNPLVPEKSSVLMKHLTALAEGGDAEAQYSLAMIYEHGIGVDENSDTANKWFRAAAGNGHAIAQRILNPPL